MGFLVSNCKDCIHKRICGIKPEYEKFISKVETLREHGDNSSDFDIVAECTHCKLEVTE